MSVKDVKIGSNAFSLVRRPKAYKHIGCDRKFVVELISTVCCIWSRPDCFDIFETKVPFDRIAGCQNVVEVGESVVFLDNLIHMRMPQFVREEFGESVKVRHLSIEMIKIGENYFSSDTLFKGLYAIELMGRVLAYKYEELS